MNGGMPTGPHRSETRWRKPGACHLVVVWRVCLSVLGCCAFGLSNSAPSKFSRVMGHSDFPYVKHPRF